MNYPSDIAFTPAVKAIQAEKQSRGMYAHMEQGRGWKTDLTDDFVEFAANLDMFYIATANGAGQPYVQYRGGPRGFLKVLDAHTIAFADFRGNRQYITLGNLSENPKVFLFLMDYAGQTRVKVWGTARVVEDDALLMARLVDPEYPGVPERVIVIAVHTWDINCRQHIQKRYPHSKVAPVLDELKERIRVLEAELAQLRGQTGNTA